MYIKTTSSLRK